jgi:HEAT repeat protein
MQEIGVFLKKCLACRKDIPCTITECPYCHADDQGRPSAVDQAAAASLEAQVQSELTQMESDDPFIRQGALDRLSQKGSAVVPILINYLNDHSRKEVSEVAKLLGRLKDRRAVGVLVQSLQIGDEALRASAVWALSQLNDPHVLEVLIRESDRPNPTVQGYLAYVLGGYQDPRVTPALIKLSLHKSREVSFQAIWALGEAGDGAAITPLRRILGRKDALIKAAAALALKRLGGPVRRAYPVIGYAAGVAVAVSTVLALLWRTYR